jgi:hypothetical protein
MKVEVFDDRNSFSHLVLGFLTLTNLSFFVLIVFYEIIEFTYKNRKRVEEPVANFIGDLFEYFCGLSFAYLLKEVMCCGGIS